MKRKSEETRNLGLRLLKMLLLRLYSMLSLNPLRWWEVLIAVVMGVLFGLGVGVMVSSYVRASVVVRGW